MTAAAAMGFEQTLVSVRARPDDEAALSSLAKTALGMGEEERALPILADAANRRRSARLWQWKALLERSLDEHADAIQSFKRAAALAPADPSIAHGRARVALEAGIPAEELFKVALHVSPNDPEVLLGYAASLFANGDAGGAETLLEHALARVPLWVEGHVQLAQLRSITGKKSRATASIERALSKNPHQEQLWTALFRLQVQAQEFPALDEAIARAKPHLPRGEELLRYESIAASESGDVSRADRLFAAMTPGLRQSVAVWFIRHLLRFGRLAEACTSIDAALKTDAAPNVWPYAAIAWRLAADPRWEWLEGDLDRLISVIDLSHELPDMGALEKVLRKLHSGKGEYLDQSVRGGSQTDGPLFTRIDPEIRALRRAIVGAVESYVRDLPATDPAHPLLAARRDRRTRFSGSWSVFLRGGGYHANHVHPEGWISSALYIRLPDRTADQSPDAGCLTLGEPQAELGLNLNPFKQIEPKRGSLVLFPSYMWHGTRPFLKGERITVAFDVQRPI